MKKPKRYYLHMKIQPWDSLHVSTPLFGDAPVQAQSISAVGFVPAYSTLTALRKAFGKKAPFAVVQTVEET